VSWLLRDEADDAAHTENPIGRTKKRLLGTSSYVDWCKIDKNAIIMHFTASQNSTAVEFAVKANNSVASRA